MWKVANSARQEMRPRGTGDQAGNSRRGKMKGNYPYRTKHPNFSHQLEHVGPNKQISEVQARVLQKRHFMEVEQAQPPIHFLVVYTKPL